MDLYNDTENLISSDEYSSDDEHDEFMDEVVMAQNIMRTATEQQHKRVMAAAAATVAALGGSTARLTTNPRAAAHSSISTGRRTVKKPLKRITSHQGHSSKRRSIKWLNNKPRREKYKKFCLGNSRKERTTPSTHQADIPASTPLPAATDTQPTAAFVPPIEIDNEPQALVEPTVPPVNAVQSINSSSAAENEAPAAVLQAAPVVSELPAKPAQEAPPQQQSNSNANDPVTTKNSTPQPTAVAAEETSNVVENGAAALYREINEMFPKYNTLIERHLNGHSPGGGPDDEHIPRLLSDLQVLNSMLQSKEQEWNRLLHLKKVKEEILTRLIRKKQKASTVKSEALFTASTTLTELKSLEARLLNAVGGGGAEVATLTAQQLIEQRANMKRDELDKELANTNRVQSILISNNILSKSHDACSSLMNSSELLLPPVPLSSTQYLANRRPSTSDTNPSGHADSSIDLRQNSALHHLNKRSTPPKVFNAPDYAHAPVAGSRYPFLDNLAARPQLQACNNNSNIMNNSNSSNQQRTEYDHAPTLERLLKSTPEKRRSASTFPSASYTATAPWKYRNEHFGGEDMENGRYGSTVTQQPVDRHHQQQHNSSMGNHHHHQFSNEISIIPVQAMQSANRKITCQQAKLQKFASAYASNAPFNSTTTTKATTSRETDVPVCQQCQVNESRFVCGGCGQQWYCSRSCQLSAWDKHSEVCGE